MIWVQISFGTDYADFFGCKKKTRAHRGGWVLQKITAEIVNLTMSKHCSVARPIVKESKK